MSTIHLHQTTTLTPEQCVAGLPDFGPGRSKIFGNSADEYLKMHNRGGSQADITEGSGGIWERLHYDWSDPNRVGLTTTVSNVWGGASGHTYTFTRQPNGTTDIDVVVIREDKTEAQAFASRFMRNKEVALDTLVREELGIDPGELGGDPWRATGSSFALFAVGAFVPVLASATWLATIRDRTSTSERAQETAPLAISTDVTSTSCCVS